MAATLSSKVLELVSQPNKGNKQATFKCGEGLVQKSSKNDPYPRKPKSILNANGESGVEALG